MKAQAFDLNGQTYWGVIDRQMHVAERFTEYLVGLSGRRSPGTVKLYANWLARFGTFLQDYEPYRLVPVDQVFPHLTLYVIEGFLRNLQATHKPRTVRLAETIVRGFATWLSSSAAGRVLERPLYEPDTSSYSPKPAQGLPDFLLWPDVVRLIMACRYEAQRVAIHALYDTGLRESELPRIALCDLPDAGPDESQMYFDLRVPGSKGRNGQFKPRETVISRPLLARIRRLHSFRSVRFQSSSSPSDRPAFPNVHGDRWTTKALQSVVSRAARKAGLGTRHPHVLRHGFALSVLASDHAKSLDDRLLLAQIWLGHEQLGTTQEFYLRGAPAVLDRIRRGELTSRYKVADEIYDKTFLRERDQPVIRRIGERRKDQ